MDETREQEKSGWTNLLLICLSQFGVNFSFNFMFAFLPFYLREVSAYSTRSTLLWIGVILGSTSVCIAFSGPFWGSLTHRIKPKFLFTMGMLVHTLTFLAMGFATSLPFFLFLRILQGVLGGTSTIALVMISARKTSTTTRDMGLFQSSVTLGQLLGPPIGTIAVTWLGYRGGFIAAAGVLLAMFLLARAFVIDIPRLPKPDQEKKQKGVTGPVLVTWLLCVAAQVQLMFLPAILPEVFLGLRLDQASAIYWAGMLIALYTVTSMAGTYVWCALAHRTGIKRMIGLLVVGGMILQIALILPQGIFGFAAIRMAQTFLIAAAIPLSLALFAGTGKGFTMGFLYSSRFAGNAIAPVMATSVLAFSGFPVLCLSIGALSIAALAVFRFGSRTEVPAGACGG